MAREELAKGNASPRRRANFENSLKTVGLPVNI